MNFSQEEREYVRFAIENCRCDEIYETKECPGWSDCDENNSWCSQILARMQRNDKLTKKDTSIIEFWSDAGKLWHNDCIAINGTECPNYSDKCEDAIDFQVYS